jgi:uncharacterized Zn-finger protein
MSTPAVPPAGIQGIAAPQPEVIVVEDRRIACDGGNGALGHPRVYLEMGGQGFVECGYCDRRFVLGGRPHGESELIDPAAYDAVDTPEA